MRTRTAYLSCAIVAATGLLAPTTALATGGGSCSSLSYDFSVAEGPCPVANPSSPACAAEGDFTGIRYELTAESSQADHVFTLVTANNTVSAPPAVQLFAPCVGDNLIGLGKHSCHEQAVKVNPQGLTRTFWVVVAGKKTPIDTSIAVKKGSCVKRFAIAGLGLDTNPFQQAQKAETVNFKGCAVKFMFDPVTGAVVSAALDPDASTKPVCEGEPDDSCCSLTEGNVNDLSLTLQVGEDVLSLGAGQFGEGYISSGEESCTTRVIGGRVYTWGSPCP